MARTGDNWANFSLETGVEWAGLDWILLTGEETDLHLGDRESGGFGLALEMGKAGEWHWEDLTDGFLRGEGLKVEIWSSKPGRVWFNLVFGSDDVGRISEDLSCCAAEDLIRELGFGESTFWSAVREFDKSDSEVVDRCCDLWSLVWSAERLFDLDDDEDCSASRDGSQVSGDELIFMSELHSPNVSLVISEKDGVEGESEYPKSPPSDKSSFPTAINLKEEKQTCITSNNLLPQSYFKSSCAWYKWKCQHDTVFVEKNTDTSVTTLWTFLSLLFKKSSFLPWSSVSYISLSFPFSTPKDLHIVASPTITWRN